LEISPGEAKSLDAAKQAQISYGEGSAITAGVDTGLQVCSLTKEIKVVKVDVKNMRQEQNR
jgi:hypothetical protein